MKIINTYNLFTVVLSYFIWACKKPFNPKIVSSADSYLVVGGVINSSNDSTIIKLSKTVNISGNAQSNTVNDAKVTVEAEGGAVINLLADGAGNYFSANLNLDAAQKYRLHIITTDSKEYTSDYVSPKSGPAIDSIGFTIKNNQVQLYVNTHDATNNTRYYRWSYDETWRFHAQYQSNFEVDPVTKTVVPRKQSIYYYFAGNKSSSIVLGSSTKLTQDVIYQAPVTTLAAGSEKIGLRYSILVKQYALTKEAYQFWDNLKKNTEQLGSIFDAQPSQLVGNIHNLKDASEPVIGYLSVTNIQSKRFYIDNFDLPHIWTYEYPYECGSLPAYFKAGPNGVVNEVDSYIIRGGNVPLEEISVERTVLGYTYSTVQCADCSIRGTVKTHSFWKER